MQSEPSEVISQPPAYSYDESSNTAAQHGYDNNSPSDPLLLLQRDERSSHHASGSEWSRSASAETSPSRLADTELDDLETASARSRDYFERSLDDYNSVQEVLDQQRSFAAHKAAGRKRRFPFEEFPEELLFHVISHLSASDLLSVKLVSRRFHDIVKSPHAWIDAFSRYFPGPDALARTADASASDIGISGLRSEKRAFTRINPTASWTSEFLSRTKLLRCLGRGKPAIPFAAPSPGKPNKGYATFTYGSRLVFGVTHLHAKFGPVLDKRQPHFIHGFSKNGTVSSSDRRGKLDGWGLLDQGNFQTFSHFYPGTPQWGLGPGEVVGLPNVMDLSSLHGMIYGEGIPGGTVYYLASGEKHGRYLRNLPAENARGPGIPKVLDETTAVCSVWIAKTPELPRVSKGLIGILCGASNGVVSAFSLGTPGDSTQRWERGELTARWILSPGVPVISIIADDDYSEERRDQNRVWALAVNALGEVFHLNALPRLDRTNHTGDSMEPELAQEISAWDVGKSAHWQLVGASRRSERVAMRFDTEVLPTYYPGPVLGDTLQQGLTGNEINAWLSKRPMDIRAEFDGWNMRRRVEVDFAGDDAKSGGENIAIFECGDEDDQMAAAWRYTRCAFGVGDSDASIISTTTEVASDESQGDGSNTSGDAPPALLASQPKRAHYEWRCSRLLFGRTKSFMITTTAIDSSNFAKTTCSHDMALRLNPQRYTASNSKTPSKLEPEAFSPLKMPGQRARFVAAGTSNGRILVWNIRAPPSGSANVVNDIRPIRIIYTESPEITALALTALYLVHGGSEGLVQAWDPLASSLEPIRTISSRNTLNARRRAVIAAQQNPIVQAQMVVSTYAATAICLDNDPAVLRGIVAIGSHLRYWSFSSTAAMDDISKSQKRKLNRAARGLTGKPGEGFMGTRRVSLKGLVSHDLAEQALEEKDKRAQEKEQRRFAGRFGLDLLGHDASEEELIAYAKLLSEEHQEAQSPQGHLGRNASFGEIEAFKSELSAEDLERWQYASWEERFGMPKSHSETPTASHALTPSRAGLHHEESDLEKAIRLSLAEDAAAASSWSPRQTSTPPSSLPTTPKAHQISESLDPDMAAAIKLSLAEVENATRPAPTDQPAVSGSSHHVVEAPSNTEEDDLAEAIRLSLQEQQLNAPRRDSRSATDAELAAHLPDEGQFPALTSPSPGTESPTQAGARKRGKGKGKGPLAWS